MPHRDALTQPVSPPNQAGAVVSSGWLGSQSIFEHKDERKMGRAMGASVISHGVLLAIILIAMTWKPVSDALAPELDKVKFVFMQDPGPGGGGGGSPAPAPPKPIEVPKHKPPVTTVTPPPVVVPPPPAPIPTLTAPVETNAANVIQATGSSSVSLASYGGAGKGTGIGPGTGSGVGPGEGGGFGGGALRPGNGIVNPTELKFAEPKYTSDAMRAKIQGLVTLEAVVLPNGTVGDVRVVNSLDSQYGLDQEAIKAVKGWLFHPATRQGVPVPIIVTLEVMFRLH
jgi:TonB family protein